MYVTSMQRIRVFDEQKFWSQKPLTQFLAPDAYSESSLLSSHHADLAQQRRGSIFRRERWLSPTPMYCRK
jgi:hypothetical protein